jgi:hypothetical protein
VKKIERNFNFKMEEKEGTAIKHFNTKHFLSDFINKITEEKLSKGKVSYFTRRKLMKDVSLN